jgi:4-hydroxy-4-methyl-2-oxoglutarate aldolase
MKPVVVRNIDRADAGGMEASGELGLDMYKMREALAKAGLVYLDHPEQA